MKITFDLSKKSWKHDMGQNDGIGFAFTNGGEDFFKFDNLSFGVDVFDGSKSFFSGSFPNAVTTYDASHKDIVVATAECLFPEGALFTINAWVENAGTKSEKTFSYELPKPAMPFPSWVWDANKYAWVAPVPKPEEPADPTQGYVWDEDSGDWILHTYED